MIHTSIIHINTSFLPLYFGAGGFILQNAGRIYHKDKLKQVSYRLYLLTGLVTTFTCAFGGASIRSVESAPGIDQHIVKTHAWTAMAVFLITLLLVYYSFKAIRGKTDNKYNDRMLFITTLAFLIVFTLTTIVAFRIR